MSFVQKISRWLSAGLLLAIGALWSASLSAASGLPAGTFVLDVANKTQSFGDASETVKEVRKNRCQLDQSPALTIMGYQADGGNEVSRGDQKQAFGIKSQGQDCGFAGAEQAWTFVPASGPDSVIPSAAAIGGWVLDFIVTDDAIFEISLLDDSGSALELLDEFGAPLDDGEGSPVTAFTIYSGKSACDDGGTSGDPIEPEAWEQVVFPCVAQSNPNSDFGGQAGFRPDALNTFGDEVPSNLTIPEGVRQIKINVITGSVGVTAAEIDFELIPTGSLTCETDGSPGSEEVITITPPEPFISIGDGAQCRRLPNRNGTACDAVPYILGASCDGNNENCEFDFQHGTQTGVPREQHAFICEVWWPSREPNFDANGVGDDPILDRTEVFWGGLTTPLTQGADLNYCQGVTPLFTGSTFSGSGCGTGLVYELSDNVGPVDGGTVSDSGGSCSLLQAYDDVLLLAAGVEGAPPDQCTASTCPGGNDPGTRQLACLLQERIVLEEDVAPYGTSGVQTGAGRISEAATPTARKHEVILIEGDIKFRGL